MKAEETKRRTSNQRDHEVSQGDEKRTRAWVSYIAIFLGVGMTIIGFLLILWGLAWQTEVGEVNNIDGDSNFGGPALLPFGVVTLAIGLMWIVTGWNRFKKGMGREMMKTCENCGKQVEEDLNFCYFCNTKFTSDEGSNEKRRRARSLDDAKR